MVTVAAAGELSGTEGHRAPDDAFGGGLAAVGAAVRVGGSLVAESAPVAGAKSATRDIVISVSRLTTAAPATLSVEFYAWAVDQAGNCTAAGAGGVAVACTYINNVVGIPTLTGQTATLQVTATSTAPQVASAGTSIGDLVVDAARRFVYVSNQQTNSVEAFSWSAPTFARTARAFVGAAPLGMTIENGGNRLIVANSGGTSLSYVQLGEDFRETDHETLNAVCTR
jgi:DNA-binding beta-propeller fold protein YncE